MKAPAMKSILLTTALILSCSAFQTAASLEMTATSRDVQAASPEISVTAQNALVIAAISKVNKDLLAVLNCNKQNKFYKPADTTADANGCVGISLATTTTNHSVALPDVKFNSYPGYAKSSKGHSGTSTRTIDLSGLVAAGAKAISVKGTLSGFTGGCSGVSGGKTMNIADVNKNVSGSEVQCHYDKSPNRSSYFYWAYNGNTKVLTVRARMGQVKAIMTSAKISKLTATYSVTKTVLKIGDGK